MTINDEKPIAIPLSVKYGKDDHDLPIDDAINVLQGMVILCSEGAAAFGIEAGFDALIEAKPGSFEFILRLQAVASGTDSFWTSLKTVDT